MITISQRTEDEQETEDGYGADPLEALDSEEIATKVLTEKVEGRENFVGLEDALTRTYGEDSIEITAYDNGRRGGGREDGVLPDGREYLKEATVTIYEDDDPVRLHVSEDAASGSDKLQLRIESDDVDPVTEIYDMVVDDEEEQRFLDVGDDLITFATSYGEPTAFSDLQDGLEELYGGENVRQKGEAPRGMTSDGETYVREGHFEIDTENGPLKLHVDGKPNKIAFTMHSPDRGEIEALYEEFDDHVGATSGSSDRSTFRTDVSGYSWDDIGGLDDVKHTLQTQLLDRLENPEMAEEYGLDVPSGVMLYGPPGTGKTLTAKALASEADMPFYSASINDLTSKWYGQSEEYVNKVFEDAKEEDDHAVVFFDEFDALGMQRDASQNDVTARVVSTLLDNLDGLEEMDDVTVMAATNRLDDIDEALLRPGRIEKQFEVGLPDYDDRKEILEVHTEGKPLAEDVDLDELASETDGTSGADIEYLVAEATEYAFERDDGDGLRGVQMDDFEEALEELEDETSEPDSVNITYA